MKILYKDYLVIVSTGTLIIALVAFLLQTGPIKRKSVASPLNAVNENNLILFKSKSSRSRGDSTSSKRVINIHLCGPLDEISQLVLDGKMANAIYMAEMETDPVKRSVLYKKIASLWSQINSSACLAWVLTIGNANDKLYAFVETVEQASKKYQHQAFSMLDGLPNGQLKDRAMLQLVPVLMDEDPHRLLEMMSDLSNSSIVDVVSGKIVASMLDGENFPIISKLIADIPSSYLKGSLITAVTNSLAKKDPLAAMEWFAGNVNQTWGQDKLNAMIIADGFSAIDAFSGIPAADKLTDPKVKAMYLNQLGGRWAETRPEEAKQWLLKTLQQSDYSFNKAVSDGIVQGLVFFDNQEAIQFVEDIPDITSKTEARWATISALADDDPVLAGSYFLSFATDYDARSQTAMNTIVSKWLDRDSNEASQWIGSLRPSPLKDQAVENLIKNILVKAQDYTLATSWAHQISSGESRVAVLARIKEQQENGQ